MYFSQIATISALFGLTFLAYQQSTDSTIAPAAQHVLQTLFWSLSATSVATTGCVIAAIALGPKLEIGPGTEVAACVPYSVGAFGITARLQIFSMGGYGPEEWAYIKASPKLAVRTFGQGFDRLMGQVKGAQSQVGGKEL